MERSQEYEPLILDLQKSQTVQQPKRYVLVSLIVVAVVSLLSATTFAVLYFAKPPTPIPAPAPTVTPSATPTPEAASRIVAEPTPLPVATPTPEPEVVATTAPPAQTGFLTLYSSPDNAEVVIDGTVLGRTPLQEYELPVGTYTVKFVHEGQASEFEITITAGETTEYTHKFQGFASLRIRAIPSSSSIYINGKLAGRRSPLTVDGLLPGTYTILARRTGYASTEKPVVLQKGEQQDVLITLRRLGLMDNDDGGSSSSTPVPLHPSERLERLN
jgi:hypothetical protein